jgi:hypothetical protein
LSWRRASQTPATSAAAEVKLSGGGTFKPPSAEQLAALPADLGFSRADLASGNWSFSVRYDDSIPDKDPDPYVARYLGAIRAFRTGAEGEGARLLWRKAPSCAGFACSRTRSHD